MLNVKNMSSKSIGSGSTNIDTIIRMPKGNTIPPRADCNVRNCGGIVTKLIASIPLFHFLSLALSVKQDRSPVRKKSKYRANNDETHKYNHFLSIGMVSAVSNRNYTSLWRQSVENPAPKPILLLI